MLLQEAILVSVVWVVVEAMLMCVACIVLEARLISKVCTVTEGRVRVFDAAPARDCVNVCGPSYHQKPQGYLWSVLSPETMLMSMGWASTGDHIGVIGPCCPRDHVDVLGLCCFGEL